MRILGIETSCDETAASVVEDGAVLSNVVLSQTAHRRFGGVVPEVASRAHVEMIVPIVRQALAEGCSSIEAVDCIAVTLGPGLIGSLIVGVAFAKSLCLVTGRPLVGVDHIESHIAANYLAYPDLPYPFVCLVVSGGHTHLFRVDRMFSLRLLGCTRDDAAGEAFDKVARMLGLEYPGGPEIEKEAAGGDPGAIDFPRPIKLNPNEFSFSGLKTAVRYFIDRHQGEISPALRADIAASFQAAATDVLVEKTIAAATGIKAGAVSAVGGVAANSDLRRKLTRAAQDAGLALLLPPKHLCTDNAAIVAARAYLSFGEGHVTDLAASPYSTRSFTLPPVA